jgi:alpha-N-acetylglucosamine transferase
MSLVKYFLYAVLVTEKISTRMQKILELDGAKVVVVKTLLPKALHDKGSGQWGDCFTKLHLWDLPYQSIFCNYIVFIVDLDTDVLPIKNLDDAFDIKRGEFLAPADRDSGLNDLPTFNAGVLLIRYIMNNF